MIKMVLDAFRAENTLKNTAKTTWEGKESVGREIRKILESRKSTERRGSRERRESKESIKSK